METCTKFVNVFLHLPPLNSCRRKKTGTRHHKLTDKWIPAMCRNPPLCVETPPSQTEVILMDSEMKENPNPHVPLTQVSQCNRADAWWEFCYTNRSSGTGGWRERGRKKWGKTATDGAKSNTTAPLLSISKFSFMLDIKRESSTNPIFGNQFNVFLLVVDVPVVSLGFNE